MSKSSPKAGRFSEIQPHLSFTAFAFPAILSPPLTHSLTRSLLPQSLTTHTHSPSHSLSLFLSPSLYYLSSLLPLTPSLSLSLPLSRSLFLSLLSLSLSVGVQLSDDRSRHFVSVSPLEQTEAIAQLNRVRLGDRLATERSRIRRRRLGA